MDTMQKIASRHQEYINGIIEKANSANDIHNEINCLIHMSAGYMVETWVQFGTGTYEECYLGILLDLQKKFEENMSTMKKHERKKRNK